MSQQQQIRALQEKLLEERFARREAELKASADLEKERRDREASELRAAM